MYLLFTGSLYSFLDLCLFGLFDFANKNSDVVCGEEIGDRFAPFDDDDVVGIFEVVGEVVGHETRIGEAVEIIMDEVSFAIGQGVRFGDGETGTSDGFFDAKTFGKTTNEGGLAGANVADELDNDG